jgi:transposase-like protein
MTKKKPSDKLKKAGRKSLYNPEFHPKKAGELALMGKTNEEIAKTLGITTETLNQWRKQFPEFSDSIKGNKDQADAPVVKSLYQRALGYEYTEISEKHDPEKGLIKTVTVKQVAPDVTAQIFWLKNRQPKDWRDKRDVEIGGKDGKPLAVKILKNVSMDDL